MPVLYCGDGIRSALLQTLLVEPDRRMIQNDRNVSGVTSNFPQMFEFLVRQADAAIAGVGAAIDVAGFSAMQPDSVAGPLCHAVDRIGIVDREGTWTIPWR